MSKIAYYPSAEEPLQLSDRLIGTEAYRSTPSATPLATKNFSLGELLDLFSSNFPAASLQAVLDTGNTATQNITLFGTITSTVMKPTNIEDTSGSQGTTFQVLSKGSSSINWINIPVDNLQAVINAGNTATGNITLVGNITSSLITPSNIKDETGATGVAGQLIIKTSTGFTWSSLPPWINAGLNDVLSVGNTSSIPIIIESVDEYTQISSTDITVNNNVTGKYSFLSSDGALGLGNGINGSLLKSTNTTQSITLEFPNKAAGTYTIATTDDVPTVGAADRMQTIGRNSTGATLYKGTVVYILGSTGNRPNFVKAQANSEATSAGTFGIILADMPNNTDGYAVTIGTIDSLDTRSTAPHPFTNDTLADGDTIYLSPTTAGYVTNVKPYAPSHLVYVGKVVRTSPTNGTIVYRIQNGYELDEIHDVSAQTPSNNDGLFYESSTSLWKNKSIPTVLGYTPTTNARTISTTSPLSGGGDLSADRTLSISQATTSTNGYLSSTDWNTFNGKFTLPSLTSGSVLFSNGTTITQDNSNLFWDNTNKRLGIGTNAPAVSFDLRGNQLITFADIANRDVGPYAFSLTNGTFSRFNTVYDTSISRVNIFGTSTQGLRIEGGANNSIQSIGGGGLTIAATSNNLSISASTFILNTGGSERMRIFSATGNVAINTTTDAGYRLDVNGTARVSGALTIGSNAIITSGVGGGFFGAFFNQNSIPFQYSQTFIFQSSTLGTSAVTSGSRTSFSDVVNWGQSSGTADFASFRATPTINQTGGANGITRGLYINPTLTAAADWRAIEVTSGGAYINTSSVNSSAILQADSTTKGFLPPRMTTTQKNAIATPAAGLVVYDTVTNKHCGYNGTTWNDFY